MHTSLLPATHPSLLPSIFYPSIHPSILPFIHPSTHPSIHISLLPSIHPSIHAPPASHPFSDTESNLAPPKPNSSLHCVLPSILHLWRSTDRLYHFLLPVERVPIFISQVVPSMYQIFNGQASTIVSPQSSVLSSSLRVCFMFLFPPPALLLPSSFLPLAIHIPIGNHLCLLQRRTERKRKRKH